MMARRFFTPSAPPADPVVSLAEMKLHLRRDDEDDNDAIVASEAAAVRYIEGQTNRLLQVRSATLRLDRLPFGRGGVELPGGVVASIDGVTIEGEEFAEDAFIVLGEAPARLIPTIDWPAMTDRESYPVEIRYTVGYSEVPADLIAAIKLVAGHWYANREASTEKSMASLPMAVDAIVSRYRIMAR